MSPRGVIALMRASQARAVLDGQDFVAPATVKAMAIPVLAHGVILSQSGRRTQLALCGAKFEHVGPFRQPAELELVLRALALAQADGSATFASYVPRVRGVVPSCNPLTIRTTWE